MERYKLILAYDGAGFAGSQRQARHRTVQGELEKALCALGWKGRTVMLAGRTDAGVHASGQVAAFDFDWSHGSESLLEALNASLPEDMAVRNVQIVGPQFHARFDATSRRYRYSVYCQPVRDPLLERYAWRVWPALDDETFIGIADVFLGQHDFAAFGSAPRADGGTLRTVTLSAWKKIGRSAHTAAGDEWQFEVRADAFLYRMVRRLVFAQVCVAQGRCPRAAVAEALNNPRSKNKIPAGLAPAHGLTLVEVTY